MTITLIGPMGAGKSTVGRLLAARLHWPFVDVDEVIVSRAGKSIPDIFERDGQCIFRALEGEVLAEICSDAKAKVVAAGGGAVLAQANRELMRAAGPVIWLDVAPEVSASRIQGDRNRPLLAGVDPLAKARELDRQRRPLYASAGHLHLHTDQMIPSQAVDAICAFLSEWPHGKH